MSHWLESARMVLLWTKEEAVGAGWGPSFAHLVLDIPVEQETRRLAGDVNRRRWRAILWAKGRKR